MTTKLYVENIDTYNELTSKKYLIKENASIQEVKNGIILPPKKQSTSTRNGIFAGGVATKNFEFVSGMKRHGRAAGNYSCLESYKVEESVIYIDEEVIFGGIIIKHFGHAILEDLSRLWYIVKHKKDTRRVCFVCYQQICEYHYKLFELIGLTRDRVVIIDKPTQFKKIIVPDETIHSWYGYKKEYNIIYDEIKRKIKPKKYKKVYFTRTGLNDSFDVNEEFFEKFYKKQGYKIVSPEKLSLEDQIAYAAGAEELVTTLGTLSHFGLFMDYGAKLVIYNRTLKNKLTPQYIINEARKLNVIYIDALLELLPVEHTGGLVLMYPTKYFLNYINDNNIDYHKEINKIDKAQIILTYLENYAKNYSYPDRYFSIENYDLYDVINGLSTMLNQSPVIKENMFPKKRNIHLKRYWIKKSKELELNIQELTKELENTKKELEEEKKKNKNVTASFSWKITKPLRTIKRKIKRK